jgi:molybdenum cofactor guanylyltransferase
LHADTLGCVLAGGQATRLGGGDKTLLDLRGRPLLAHVLARLVPQCGALALNANGDASRFAGFGLPVWPDTLPGRPGPLAGVLAALEASPLPFVLTVPGDAPFLPPDLVARLHAARAGAVIAQAASGGQVHPVVALWPRALAPGLRVALAAGERAVHRFAAAQGAVAVEWPSLPQDPFLNINTPEDLARAKAIPA